jgi:Spy/CpxP family protein refolding chaperone
MVLTNALAISLMLLTASALLAQDNRASESPPPNQSAAPQSQPNSHRRYFDWCEEQKFEPQSCRALRPRMTGK